MQGLNEAIKLAIEKGGYDPTIYSVYKMIFHKDGTISFIDNSVKNGNVEIKTSQDFFLNPEFWQALGNALGWPPNHTAYEGWKNRWHDFIDHLADGKDAESFFQELLTKE